MLYVFLGSTLLGALSTVFLLWRKSVVEKALVQSQDATKTAQDSANRALSELKLRAETFQDQLKRQTDQIDTIRKQRDEALRQMVKSGTPGSVAELLRMRTQQITTGDTKDTPK